MSSAGGSEFSEVCMKEGLSLADGVKPTNQRASFKKSLEMTKQTWWLL